MPTNSFFSLWWDGQGQATLWLAGIWALLFLLAKAVRSAEEPRLRTTGVLVVLHLLHSSPQRPRSRGCSR